MQLVIIVLNKVEFLEDLLVRFADDGISGATILDSTGMAQVLGHSEDLSIFGSLRLRSNPEREESKTIFTVIPEEKVAVLRKAFNDVVGDISQPDTGILIGVPVDFVDGMGGLPRAR